MVGRIVAAIDFGTHGTGFAWAFTSEAKRAPQDRRFNFFDDWTGQPTNYIKTLTALLLDGSGKPLDWGYQAQRRFRAESREHPEYQYAQTFKMGLLPAEGTGSTVPTAPGKSPRELVTDYLGEFCAFALERVLAGSGVTPDEIVWCLTVPAIWKDRERQIMRECAVAAGLPADPERLLIAVEPEVAALYCRYDSGRFETPTMSDRFMVVDAGGGTVDITAYQQTSDGLTEIGYTDGGSLGSTYIDRFLVETILPERLGEDFVRRAQKEQPVAFFQLLDEWERGKRAFDAKQRLQTILPLSFRLYQILTPANLRTLADKQNGVDDAIVLEPEEMERLFDHVVEPLLQLVDDQLDRIGGRGVDWIALVGGFGQSPYLQQRLREHVEGRTEVVTIARASWAVLLGAVHYALEPNVIDGRRTRYTYGVSSALPYDPLLDPVGQKIKRFDGLALCQGRFEIFVRADDVVPLDTTVVRTFIPIRAEQSEMTIQLFTSTDREPRYVTDAGCRSVGQLSLDMSATVDLPPGDRVIEVKMIFGGTEVDARARDVKTGTEYKATIKFG